MLTTHCMLQKHQNRCGARGGWPAQAGITRRHLQDDQDHQVYRHTRPTRRSPCSVPQSKHVWHTDRGKRTLDGDQADALVQSTCRAATGPGSCHHCSSGLLHDTASVHPVLTKSRTFASALCSAQQRMVGDICGCLGGSPWGHKGSPEKPTQCSANIHNRQWMLCGNGCTLYVY